MATATTDRATFLMDKDLLEEALRETPENVPNWPSRVSYHC
jgi:hypothetical protein